MQIEEAIRVKMNLQKRLFEYMSVAEREANQLGIEALKRLHYIRKMDAHEDLYLLPGETKE